MLPIRTILHPTDFSERSELAFRVACSLARDYNARLVILHIVEPPMAVAGEGVLMVPPPVDMEPLRKRLQQLRPEDCTIAIEHRLIQGDPALEILEVAELANCDLIVMGTHGRTGLGRLLMGSVTEQIVRKAACPVLTVKTPLTAPVVAEAARPHAQPEPVAH